jgi:hypothetical protein
MINKLQHTAKLLLFVLGLLVGLNSFANGQSLTKTIPLGSAGTLTFTSTLEGKIFCGRPNSFPISMQYFFHDFIYTTPAGVVYPLDGGLTYFSGTGTGCPPQGPEEYPLNLTGPGLTIPFYATSPVNGTADLQLDPVLINTKYVILMVSYAPPGAKSTVTYSANTLVGTSTSLSQSFSNQTGFSITVGVGAGVEKIASVDGTFTSSTNYTQEKDSSSSVAITQTAAQTTTVDGPVDSSLGVDHDYDKVWLWLNPVLNFAVAPNTINSLIWNGYTYDPTDIPAMDIFPIELGYLTGKWPLPADKAAVLARGWASGQVFPPGQGPGLTSEDLQAIAAADPFSDPFYTFNVPVGNITSSDGRFTVADTQDISYAPAAPGAQPAPQSFSQSYAVTDVLGQGSKYTFQQGFSWELKESATLSLVSFTNDLKLSDTLTWVHQWSQNDTNATTTSTAFSITPPASTDNYTGPTKVVIFQDNLFHTYMFYAFN